MSLKASPSGTRTLGPPSSQDLVCEHGQWLQAWGDSWLRCQLFGNILARFGLVCQTLQALVHVASIQGGQSSACRGIWMAADADRRASADVIIFRIKRLWKAIPVADTFAADKAKLTAVPRAHSKFFEVQKFTEVPRPTSSLHSSPPPSYLLYSVNASLFILSPTRVSSTSLYPCSAFIVSSSPHFHPLPFCLPLNSLFSPILCLTFPSPLSISSLALSLTIFHILDYI